jgi:hypothetical protein
MKIRAQHSSGLAEKASADSYLFNNSESTTGFLKGRESRLIGKRWRVNPAGINNTVVIQF